MDFLFPGSFGWIFFEIILLPFSWTLNSKFECPERRYIFPEFNPYILYQKSWLSNNILNHVVCLLATFQCADIPPPVYSKPPFNGQTFYICLASTLVPGDLLVDLFLQIFSTSSQTTRDLFTAILWLEILITLRGTTLYLTLDKW